MLALLPSALAFRITGAELHEILGLATVAAFALHNILNRAWYRSLGRGRYNADRSAGTAVVAAIAACAAACAVSGVALSGFVFGLSDRFGGLGIRAVHTTSAYWTFVLCGVHVGLRAGFLRGRVFFRLARNARKTFRGGVFRFLRNAICRLFLPDGGDSFRRGVRRARPAETLAAEVIFHDAKMRLAWQTALGSGIAALSFGV